MLWPFNRFRNPRAPARGTIEAIYGMIVTQAREPAFYRDMAVPDTVNGRFDLLLLHLWMVLHRLRALDGGPRLAQALFDRFCEDMDDNLREMGVGDLTVPKRMQAFGEAFYGRTVAYDAALNTGDLARDALADSLCKNVFNGESMDKARLLAAYARLGLERLSSCGIAEFARGGWRFPAPSAVVELS